MTESIQRGLHEPTRDKILTGIIEFIRDFGNDSVVFAAERPDSKHLHIIRELGKAGGGISCSSCGIISDEDIFYFLLFDKTENFGIGCNLCESCVENSCKFIQSAIKDAVRMDVKTFIEHHDVGFQISLGGVK